MNAREKRRLRPWLPSIMMVVLIAAAGFAAVAVNNSWWVDPSPTAAPDQTAPNGSSVFTGTGTDYIGRTGLVVIRLDDESLSAAELGLESDGVRAVSADRPLIVQVVGPEGALAVERAESVGIATEQGEVTAVEVLQIAQDGFLGARATLDEVAELYGWPADEIDTLPDRFREARTADPDSPTSITVGPGTETGLAISATLTVDGGALLTYVAERLP